MNFPVNCLSNINLSLFRDNIPVSSNEQVKKIVAIAAFAFVCLAALYLCCKSFSANAVEIKKEDPKDDFNWTGLDALENKLSEKIIGQPYAIKVTVEALKRHVSGLRSSKSPIGTFLYAGPTGVGKTQLAKELAIELLGDEKRLIRLDMSAFTEEHSLTRLIGSLPGYKQHEQGGQLTEALKQNPKAIVLIDEIDKANPQVLKTFLQVFDEGFICDAQGTVIDCRNAIFILTTNLGAKKILKLSEEGNDEEEILEEIKGDIIRFLSPELYNRLEVAPFLGLGEEQLEELISNMLKEVEKDLSEKKQISVEWDPSIVDFVKTNGYDYELGARPLKRMLDKSVNTVLAQEIIAGRIHSGDSIRVYHDDDEVKVEKKEAAVQL